MAKKMGWATNRYILVFSTILFGSFSSQTHGEELWGHIMETTAGNGYIKKNITLGLQVNYLRYLPAKKENNSRVLVMITGTDTSKYYFESVSEKLQPEISVINYIIETKGSEGLPFAEFQSKKVGYQKNRLKQYVTQNKLIQSWPPIHPEAVEIEYELARKKTDQKILLIAGKQSDLLIRTRILKNFNKCVAVSPDESLGEMDKSLWADKQVLWIGADFELPKLEDFKKKFGGEILFYKRSSTGQQLLMRNMQVMDDILKWLNG